jgi:hypothetical protein
MSGRRILVDKASAIRLPYVLAKRIVDAGDHAVANSELEDDHYFSPSTPKIQRIGIFNFKRTLLSEQRYKLLIQDRTDLSAGFIAAFQNPGDEYLVAISKGLSASLLLSEDGVLVDSRENQICRQFYDDLPKLNLHFSDEYPVVPPAGAGVIRVILVDE